MTMRQVLSLSLTLRGFIVHDLRDGAPDFHDDVAGWIADGRVRYREDIIKGFANAPEAFIGLLEGQNFGKLIVEVGR